MAQGPLIGPKEGPDRKSGRDGRGPKREEVLQAEGGNQASKGWEGSRESRFMLGTSVILGK